MRVKVRETTSWFGNGDEIIELKGIHFSKTLVSNLNVSQPVERENFLIASQENGAFETKAHFTSRLIN